MKVLDVKILCDDKAGTVSISVDSGEFAVYKNDNPVIDRLLKYLDWPERYSVTVEAVDK